MKTIQAYRFALDLTPGQERDVLAHAGAARVAHNWALARVKAVMDQRAAERSYAVPEELLTPSPSWSLAGLRKAWNAAKDEVAPWWRECSKEAFNTGLDALARALVNWRPSSVVGVDVGITHLAVLSTGELVDNPRHLAAAHARLRQLGRALSRKTGPDRRTGRRPSKRWQRTSARLGRAHARVSNLRRDGLHKLTTRLAREHATIVVEDLNVAGMLRNRRLARHIADAGFGEIRRQLTYKAQWNGGQLIVADRWYPSSKTCSGCGAVKTKLALSEREYECKTCGLVIDQRLAQPRRPRGSNRREWPGGSTWSQPEDPHTRAGGREA
ncbi:hypothetical protein Vqi01_26250 [Micromonospora qiuiae]|uniref:Transposase n=1 Tax=Micromonospora qiuiae TaxID=502268 RepID=A0ABQ4JBD4_9ACTN|nr:RNA-guided endonuclease TnpB family protein [Micromonospora qiuiae]GIJ27463.1 hypothetical protein Vqi01_26250 [Micromonospora qiuiae]